MQKFIRYVHLWWKLTVSSFLTYFVSRVSASLFLIGKIFRFLFFIIFLLAIFSRTQFLSNYSVIQIIFFFLTYNLLDTATQLFFREVYRFRSLVVSGDFDLVLVKPMSPLFRALAGGADPLDLILLILYIFALLYVASQIKITIYGLSIYLLLLVNGFIIATGFHILVLALAVVTTEIDHAVMIYRDLTSMGRVPVDIYGEPLRSILTFVIPVGIMMTFPAKALLGFLSWPLVIFSVFMGFLFLFLSLNVWNYALRKYSSASS